MLACPVPPRDQNTVADFLSRYQGLGVSQIDASPFRLATLQQQDREIKEIWDATSAAADNKEGVAVRLKGHRHETAIRDKVLLIKVGEKVGRVAQQPFRIVVPSCMRSEIIQEAHNSKLCGHGGIFKTYERIASEFWWPNMTLDIKAHIEKCVPCQTTTSKGTLPPGPLHQLPIPAGPNQRLHVDLFGPLKSSQGGNRYVLVMTDALTKVVRLQAIPSKDATVVATAILQQWIYVFGVPKVILSDQGKEFCNDLAKAVWSSLGITHTVTSPYHPQTNAQAEVFNKTMAHYLRTAINESSKSTLDWELYLGPLMFSYNTAVHKSTRQTPFYTLFGYDPRVPLWDSQDLLTADERVTDRNQAQVLFDMRRTQAAARQIAVANQQHAQQMQQQGYDRSFRPQFSEFHPGDLVWVKTTAVSEPNQKLAPTWEAGVVVERLSAATYKVNREGRSRKKMATLNIQRLKPRTAETAPPTTSPSPPPSAPTPPPSSPPAPTPGPSSSDAPPHTSEPTPPSGPAVPPQAVVSQGPMTRARARKLAEALICAIISCPDDVDDLTEEAIFKLADLGWLPASQGRAVVHQGQSSATNISGSQGCSGSDGPSRRPRTALAAGRTKRDKGKTVNRIARRIADFLSPGSRPESYPAVGMPQFLVALPSLPVGSRIRATRSLFSSKKKK